VPSRETLSKWLQALYDWQALAGAIGVFLLLLLQIPWLAGLAANVGLEDTEEFRTVVIGLVLFSVLSQLRDMQDAISDRGSTRCHFDDPRVMYDALLSSAERISAPGEKCLEVLALTLYSAWPTLSFWLQSDAAKGWDLRLITLAPDADTSWIPRDWPAESGANIAAAEQFARRPDTVRRGIALAVSTYDFPPGVHGFRLGNGDVFVSYVHWDEDGLIGKSGFTYQLVSHTDVSPEADATRELFDNWLRRATAGVSAASTTA
jgi:hypothetical protein